MSSLSAQLDVVVAMFRDEAVKAAETEAAYKKARAKRCLKARHEGEAKSVAESELIADADDLIADMLSNRLISAALADSTKQKLLSLREQIGWQRTLMANEREADRVHSTDKAVA